MGDEVKAKIKELYESVHADGTKKYSWQQIADLVEYPKYTVRDWAKKQSFYKPERRLDAHKLEILSDGQRISERILALTAEQLNSPEALLEAHGFDSSEWQIDRATSNLWHSPNEGDTLPLYQSKITVKPGTDEFAKIIQSIKANAVPLEVEPEYEDITERYLVVNINDTHFGAATYEDYIDSQQRIIDILINGYTKTVINLCGDLLDSDNLKHTTAHGTRLNDMSMSQAWSDLVAYVEPIVIESVRSSKHTEIIFTRGNHSESMEFAFLQYLKARFPQIHIDDSLEFHKAILLGSNFIGLSHGYKNPKNLAMNLSKTYGKLWGQATHHEVIVGHQHRELTTQGALLRVLPTRAPSNEWAKENNFEFQHPAFQLMEYGPDDISAIYYV